MSSHPVIDAAMLDRARDVVTRHLAPTRSCRCTCPAWTVRCTSNSTSSSRPARSRSAVRLAAGAAYAAERSGSSPLGGQSRTRHRVCAARLGIPATVIVPETASPAKVAQLRDADVDLRQIGQDYDAAEQAAVELAAGVAGRFVSAYNDPHVIAGQATLAAELFDQAAEPATVIVPVGGGGLVAGTSLVLTGRAGWHVVGVETEHSRGLSAAVAAGEVVTVPVEETIADGLAATSSREHHPRHRAGSGDRCGRGAGAIDRAAVREPTGCGLVVEGSGAVGLAALRDGLIPGDGPVILVLTGRNIAPALLAQLLTD